VPKRGRLTIIAAKPNHLPVRGPATEARMLHSILWTLVKITVASLVLGRSSPISASPPSSCARDRAFGRSCRGLCAAGIGLGLAERAARAVVIVPIFGS